ncbi:MAG: transcriptional regulator [Ilumatobacteraceae bacterium]|nr:transcriptional regulator [Ilumatobacteraceae bacterium]
MNLSDLRYLVAVADHRHFGRAAAACHVSQPTLSTQIKKLEKELGVELIERNPRHITLTDVGVEVTERARIALHEADAIRDIARRTHDPESASIRLGIFPTLGPYLLPHVVPLIHQRFPNLELLLVEDKSEAVLAQLRAGTLDAGLLALPVDDDRLHQELLFEEDFVLAVPADHALAATEGPADVSVLAGESVLLLEDGHCLRAQALSVCQLSGASERDGFRATSLETLRQMVAAGVGVTLLPNLAVQPPVPVYDGIRLIPFAQPVPSRRIAMFWRPTSVYRGFLPKLAAIIRELPSALVSSHA